MYRASAGITSNFLARHGIYLLSIIILTSCSLIHLIDCQEFQQQLDKISWSYVMFDIEAEMKATAFSPCTNPWVCINLMIKVLLLIYLDSFLF